MGVQLLLLQAKHCAGGKKDSLLQNEQVLKVVLQCLNNQLDTEIVCDNLYRLDLPVIGYTGSVVPMVMYTFRYSDGSEE